MPELSMVICLIVIGLVDQKYTILIKKGDWQLVVWQFGAC